MKHPMRSQASRAFSISIHEGTTIIGVLCYICRSWVTPSVTRCVSHYGLAIYMKKYLKAKEELWKLKYISPCKSTIFKNPLKENQNPSRYYN
jgi:hypothetical protein